MRDLTIPRPFTVDAFLNQLARDRGRPIHLIPMPGGVAEPCGIWLSTGNTDYVVHQVTTSPLHQEHIILHELAHMVLDHATAGRPAPDLRAQLLPDLDPDVVATMLARTSYTSTAEREAETPADLIGATARRDVEPPRNTDRTYSQAVHIFGPET